MFPLAAKQCRRLSCQRSEGVSHESLAAYVHRQCKVSQSSPRWVFSHTYDPPWYLTWKDFEECHCASALRQHSVEYFWERLRGVCRCRTKYNVEEKKKKKKKKGWFEVYSPDGLTRDPTQDEWEPGRTPRDSFELNTNRMLEENMKN